MNPSESVVLTDPEYLVLGGTLLEVMKSDRRGTAEKLDAAIAIVAEILATPQPTAGAYREPGVSQVAVEDFELAARQWLERAERELSDRAALDAAIEKVTRPQARQLIYDAAFSLAAFDMVTLGEFVVLDEIADAWGLERAPGQ